MNISKAHVVYLTGTGTTKKYAEAFGEGLPFDVEFHEIRHDAELPEALASDELLVLAAPVFAGYLPPFAWECLAGLCGDSSPAVVLAVYGARDYDDSLFNAQQRLEEKGFSLFGAAALVARHSIVRRIAEGRPDADDLAEAHRFGSRIGEQLAGWDAAQGFPAFAFQHVECAMPPGPFPFVDDSCVACGVCAAECITGAIPKSAPNTTDNDRCASCLRCIDVCPNGARFIHPDVFSFLEPKLDAAADPLRANLFFEAKASVKAGAPMPEADRTTMA